MINEIIIDIYIVENRWISTICHTLIWHVPGRDTRGYAQRSRLAFPRSESIEAANWRVTSRENRRVGFRRVPASTRGIRLRTCTPHTPILAPTRRSSVGELARTSCCTVQSHNLESRSILQFEICYIFQTKKNIHFAYVFRECVL